VTYYLRDKGKAFILFYNDIVRNLPSSPSREYIRVVVKASENKKDLSFLFSSLFTSSKDCNSLVGYSCGKVVKKEKTNTWSDTYTVNKV